MYRDVADHLILGHLPLVGISYQGKDRDKMYFDKFSEKREMEKVIKAAYSRGINRFAAATSDSNFLSAQHIQVLREISKEREIGVIPCISIPLKLHGSEINPYRRWSSYLKLEEECYPNVRERVFNDPILNFRENWKERLTRAQPYKEKDFKKLTVNWSAFEGYLDEFKKLPVKSIEPGSETDLLAATGRFDILGIIIDKIHENGYSDVIFGVHHGGITIPEMDEELGGFKGYLTPLNPDGVMMLPTKASAEDAVRNTNKEVYAIKPFAGGRVKPEDAFQYVFSFDIASCIFGAASIHEVEEDVAAALKALSSVV
ncbi:MAG: hypothetical protein ACLFVP_00715 [Candidatus Bathyarchaeia archaeon]